MKETDASTEHSRPAPEPRLVRVEDRRPADAPSTCLRPLGLCELGGSCDTCWYSPSHPRFAKNKRQP